MSYAMEEYDEESTYYSSDYDDYSIGSYVSENFESNNLDELTFIPDRGEGEELHLILLL
jgi:hypothetical protein